MNRKIDFCVDLLLDMNPNLIPFYQMAPVELKELQTKLKKFLDKGFIQPIIYQWGAPVLFVKKKDKSLRICTDYDQPTSSTEKHLSSPSY